MKSTILISIIACSLTSFSAISASTIPRNSYAIIDYKATPKIQDSDKKATQGIEKLNRNAQTDADSDRFFSEIIYGVAGTVSSGIKGVTNLLSSGVKGVTDVVSSGFKGAVGGALSSGTVTEALGSLTPKLLPNFVDQYLGTPGTVTPGLIQKNVYEASEALQNANPQDIKNRVMSVTNKLASTDPKIVIQTIQSYQMALNKIDPIYLESFIKSYAPVIADVSPDYYRTIAKSLYDALGSMQVKSAAGSAQSKLEQNRTDNSLNLTSALNSSLQFLKDLSTQSNTTIANSAQQLSNQVAKISKDDIKTVLNSTTVATQSLEPQSVAQAIGGLAGFTAKLSVGTISGIVSGTAKIVSGVKPQSIESIVNAFAEIIINTSISTIKAIFAFLGYGVKNVVPVVTSQISSFFLPKNSTGTVNRTMPGVVTLSNSVVNAEDPIIVEVRDKIAKLLTIAGKAV